MVRMLDLAYKGDRNYLHGSDFYNAISQIIPEIFQNTPFFIEKIVFRRFATSTCLLTTVRPIDEGTVVGQVIFRSINGESDLEAWIVETDRSVKNRYHIDEALFVEDAVIDREKRTVTNKFFIGCTTIESVIALTRHLNYAISPRVQGKWVFGQLELQKSLVDVYQTMKIEMKSMISGRFSVNKILIDGDYFGIIKFIVGDPS